MSVLINNGACGLYPWSRDLEASLDVRVEERAGFAMLLGWLDKFLCANGLEPGRLTCERFWKESVKVRVRENWSRKRLRLTRSVQSE